MQDYHPGEIEAKWQRHWEQAGQFTPNLNPDRPKFYMLTMLPYPSGDLHIGHWYAMAPSDAYARFKAMQGHEVFFPIGFDAFGLPAENAAIKNNIHPKEWTYQNIERMRGQLRSMGNRFAWEHEVISCDPDYYKWSQWFFLRMLEKGLAYREHAPVDFCNHCQTTLAREQVWGEDRLCERCNNPVVKKALNQWKLRITDYAEELLDFSGLEWPERVRLMQTNWIGRSEGAEFAIPVQGHEESFRVFTTRPDTVFGMSFCVLAPEHELVERITTPEQKEAVDAYRELASRKEEIERTAEGKEKDGVFTGAYAINPMNGQAVPIWIADYVLASYGTGAIMAVPAHDERDFAFARKYGLPTPVAVVEKGTSEVPEGDTLEAPLLVKEESVMVNSEGFSGKAWPESFNAVVDQMEGSGIGSRQVNYRLRDWLISRQRMWGTPIPVVYCSQCGMQPVPDAQLPVTLPDDAEFKPTGESPLKHHQGFLQTTCPQCQGPAERETDTMDTFICSSWYYYAYLFPYWKKGETLQADSIPWDPEVMERWAPVDQYTGGIEHATMHLLYFRFYTKVLADLGLLKFREPALRLYNQGMILGEDHEKMSKSRGNVVNPDELVQKHGADTVRTYLMFLGPWDAGAPWNPQGIEGAARFLKAVWTLAHQALPEEAGDPEVEKKVRRTLHQTIQKVTEDLADFRFNTAIAAMMSFRNALKAEGIGRDLMVESLQALLRLLAPIAPHLTEELWQGLAPESGSVHEQPWPVYEAALTQEEEITIAIQVNGKVRERLEVSASLSQEELEQQALQAPKLQAYLEGKTVRRVIVVPGRLVNIVVS